MKQHRIINGARLLVELHHFNCFRSGFLTEEPREMLHFMVSSFDIISDFKYEQNGDEVGIFETFF